MYTFGNGIIITGRHHNLFNVYLLLCSVHSCSYVWCCIFLLRWSSSPAFTAILYRFTTFSLTPLQTCIQSYGRYFLIVSDVMFGISLFLFSLLSTLCSGFPYFCQRYGWYFLIALLLERLVYCQCYGRYFTHCASQMHCASQTHFAYYQMLLLLPMLRSTS